jgi:hypothetical protein
LRRTTTAPSLALRDFSEARTFNGPSLYASKCSCQFAYETNRGGWLFRGRYPALSLHGYMWDGGRYERLDVPGARATAAADINNRGDVVG